MKHKTTHASMELILVTVTLSVFSSHCLRMHGGYVKQNHIYLIKSVQFQTLMNVKRSQAFVQMVCASTRLAVSAVNALRDSVTTTYSWSVKVT